MKARKTSSFAISLLAVLLIVGGIYSITEKQWFPLFPWLLDFVWLLFTTTFGNPGGYYVFGVVCFILAGILFYIAKRVSKSGA